MVVAVAHESDGMNPVARRAPCGVPADAGTVVFGAGVGRPLPERDLEVVACHLGVTTG